MLPRVNPFVLRTVAWVGPVLVSWLALTAAEPIELWPAGAPGDKGGLPAEQDLTKPEENLIAGRRLIRLGNVSKPTITVYSPAADKNTGAAVVVCPGGGYHILALDLEGTEVCEWLNSIGVTGVLLKYRVPKRPGQPEYAAPLQDAQRALGLVRQHATSWGLDPNRIGVLGFSAGGNLAALLSNNYAARTYPAVDGAEMLSCRPDFSVLIYPAYLTDKDNGDRVRPELPITTNTPPTFISIAQDDPVRVENVLGYTLGLQQAKVPVELHIYPTGGHGYGLRRTENPVTFWPDRAADWMRSRGWLTRK
jgi:acetyl esterase/lipase